MGRIQRAQPCRGCELRERHHWFTAMAAPTFARQFVEIYCDLYASSSGQRCLDIEGAPGGETTGADAYGGYFNVHSNSNSAGANARVVSITYYSQLSGSLVDIEGEGQGYGFYLSRFFQAEGVVNLPLANNPTNFLAGNTDQFLPPLSSLGFTLKIVPMVTEDRHRAKTRSLLGTANIRYGMPVFGGTPIGVFQVYDRNTNSVPEVDYTPATAFATISSGAVVSVTPVTLGSDYTSATVNLSGGGGTGATVTANIVNGQVVSYSVTNGGSGYTSAPAVGVTVNDTNLQQNIVACFPGGCGFGAGYGSSSLTGGTYKPAYASLESTGGFSLRNPTIGTSPGTYFQQAYNNSNGMLTDYFYGGTQGGQPSFTHQETFYDFTSYSTITGLSRYAYGGTVHYSLPTLKLGAGPELSGVQGSAATKIAGALGTFSSGHLVKTDANGDFVDGGTSATGTDDFFTFTGCTLPSGGGSYCTGTINFTSGTTPTFPAMPDGSYVTLCDADAGSTTISVAFNAQGRTTTSFGYTLGNAVIGTSSSYAPTVMCHLHHN